MAGASLELEVSAEVSQGVVGSDGVVSAAVPGKGSIQVVKESCPGHEHLAGAELLAGAAIVADGTLEAMGLHIILDCHSGTQRTGAQQVVTAAMTVLAYDLRALHRIAGSVLEGRQGIIFAQQTDDGLAFAPAGYKGSGDSGNAFLHRKALGLENIGQSLGRLEFLEADFSIFPDQVAGMQESFLLSVHKFFDLVYHFHLDPSAVNLYINDEYSFCIISPE